MYVVQNRSPIHIYTASFESRTHKLLSELFRIVYRNLISLKDFSLNNIRTKIAVNIHNLNVRNFFKKYRIQDNEIKWIIN